MWEKIITGYYKFKPSQRVENTFTLELAGGNCDRYERLRLGRVRYGLLMEYYIPTTCMTSKNTMRLLEHEGCYELIISEAILARFHDNGTGVAVSNLVYSSDSGLLLIGDDCLELFIMTGVYGIKIDNVIKSLYENHLLDDEIKQIRKQAIELSNQYAEALTKNFNIENER